MLETYSEQQLQTLVGYEVKDSAGEKVGYVDLVFLDDQTGQPEWIGLWNGLPNGHRYLAPLHGITHEGDSVRVPWTKEQIESAPTYDEQDTRGLVIGDGDTFGIPAEQEETAHRHYGLEPPASAQAGTPRLRVWVYEVRAERIRV
jgi:sporulation protein YlmC with PRC-barrel domain